MRLAEVIHLIRNGDLLAYQGRGLAARMIGIGGRTDYSHAGMAAWWGDDLMVLEMVAAGGRAVTLESQVRAEPGLWDWYEANPDDQFAFDRTAAVREMRHFAGAQYGWGNLLRTAAYHLPVVRLFTRPEIDDAANGRNVKPFCSQAISVACRRAGVDPVPNLPDWLTHPVDLARSHLFRRRETLTP